MNGGVPSKKLNETLLNILDDLESDSNLLDNSDNIKYIISLLGAGADRDTQNRYGKTLSYYLDEKLRDILNKLAIKRDELDNPDRIQYIMLLLGTGANPNVQNQAGKTLLHYVAERNDIDGIRYFLGVIKANPSIRDQSGRTPFEYVTEPDCLQAIKDLGYDLDDSHENEGNPTTPNGSVDDCSNSSGDDSQIESVKLSDCNTEEDSSCSSSDYLFLEDSLLAKLGIPLTTDEQELINKFCEEIRGITTQNKQESEESILESIEKIVNEYLKKGLRLNSSCSNGNEKGDKETVTNLILEEIDNVLSSNHLRLRDETGARERQSDGIADQDDDNEDKVSGIIKRITSNLVSKGGVEKGLLFYNELGKHYDHYYLEDLNKQYKNRKEELKSIACEGIVNKSKQTHEHDFKAEIDNQYFYVKYSQDSIIEPAKVLNHEKAKKLNLKVGILQIGESIVRVGGTKDGKTNYTDVLKSSIEMSFTTEVGEISIYLSPSKEGGNKIKVEIDEENKAKFDKLKDKSSLGKDSLLEGENVSEVISKNFKMSDSVSTESIEITKGVPFTDFTQACSQQIDTSVKGR